MEKVYANALISALRKGKDEKELVGGLIAHLKDVGRMKILPNILRELKNASARRKTLLPQLEVANEGEKSGAVKEAKDAGIDGAAISVNPALIRGWRGRANGILVDRSGKKALIELYRNIITN
ncbi:MAG TPA: hypothetical protein VFY28_02860 [Candidatus Paceibacterota bacterium]|nr:hypothetical protein [Candidatus Paceibacterota bacterium]